MSPKTKKFSDLAAPLYADPERRARIAGHEQAISEALRLAALREGLAVTQTELAQRIGVTQENVSRVERAGDVYLSTLAKYVEGLGGHLELHAVFEDQTVPLVLPTREP